ncbi:hypothetical protein FQN49_007026 [Arthroderma sp. PD_2]|nr:hypothetical protein FQN49_007026 [Arthroderma sp. PD_2]
MEFQNLQVSEVTFKKTLSVRENCSLFTVEARGQICVMKVHPGHDPTSLKIPYCETNMFVCESTAYRRLSEAGLCERGVVPKFYGAIENIDPKSCLPHLESFLADEFPPTAIFLEYIPGMKELHWSDYTPERMENFVKGLNEIHKALVVHADVRPRNMMVLEGEPKRVLWIDFDRSQTLHGELEDFQKEWIDFENGLLSCMGRDMEADFNEQTFNRTKMYYR